MPSEIYKGRTLSKYLATPKTRMGSVAIDLLYHKKSVMIILWFTDTKRQFPMMVHFSQVSKTTKCTFHSEELEKTILRLAVRCHPFTGGSYRCRCSCPWTSYLRWVASGAGSEDCVFSLDICPDNIDGC